MNEEITVTQEMREAIDLVEKTGQNVFITGKAGTGKTTLLQYIVDNVRTKNIVVTASTGIAAVNAGGVTLHSFLGIPFGFLDPTAKIKANLPPSKQEVVFRTDTLIIDEISMVRPDIMDYVDRKLRMIKRVDEPFGGVQIVMFGDLYQLPPVVKSDENTVLKMFYPHHYFFFARIFRECGFRIVELDTVFRQKDELFVSILNNMREYRLTSDDLEDLSSLRDLKRSSDYSSGAIHICTHKTDVETINRTMLGEPTAQFTATLSDKFPKDALPCDMLLCLRPGARVMTLTNDKSQGHFNGSLGTLEEIGDESLVVRLDNGNLCNIQKATWQAFEYTSSDGKIIKSVKGTCTQFPVTLAWAVTIHKSQGLTFDNIIIHAKRIFCPGQLYVALSRCTSMEGVAMDSFVSRRQILPEPMLLRFEKAYRANNNIFDKQVYRQLCNESTES